MRSDLDPELFAIRTPPALLAKSTTWAGYCEAERPNADAIIRLGKLQAAACGLVCPVLVVLRRTVTRRFRLGDRVKLRSEVATGRFWAYRAAIGVVIDTLELPGPIYRVTVSFEARYLTTLEDQDESLFELAGPNRPR